VLTVRNRTALPTAWLRQLVYQVRPEGLAGDYLVEFLPAELPHGLADPHLRLVRVYLGGEQHLQSGLAFRWRNRITARTMAEAAVYMTAHELRHLWQHEQGLRMRTEPKERDADAYAARALRRYRLAMLPPAPPGAHARRLTHLRKAGGLPR
jgi:hypothetical protein